MHATQLRGNSLTMAMTFHIKGQMNMPGKSPIIITLPAPTMVTILKIIQWKILTMNKNERIPDNILNKDEILSNVVNAIAVIPKITNRIKILHQTVRFAVNKVAIIVGTQTTVLWEDLGKVVFVIAEAYLQNHAQR